MMQTLDGNPSFFERMVFSDDDSDLKSTEQGIRGKQ